MNVWKISDVQPGSSSGAYIAAMRRNTEQEFIAAGVHVCHGILLLLFFLIYHVLAIC